MHESIKDRHLSDLKIPGTHNSATSQISTSSKIGADAYVELGGYLPKLLSALMYIPWVDQQVVNLARAHSKSISEQLEDGIRFFDLRVSLEDDQAFYATHSLLGERFDIIFQEIKGFVEKHPQELIILNFHYLYRKCGNCEDRGFTLCEYNQFMQLLTTYLGNHLIPQSATHSDKRTVAELLNQGQVIIHLQKITNRMLREMRAEFRDKIWPEGSVRTTWEPASDCNARISHMSEIANASYNRHTNTLQVQSGALTPTLGSILRLDTCDLLEMAERVNKEIDAWLDTIEGQTVNVVTIDHYDQKEGKKVVEHLIRMNDTLG